MSERKRETLSKELIINYGISDIKIDENEKYGYAVFDRWGKKRKIQIIGYRPAIICTKKNKKYSLMLNRMVYAWFVEPVKPNEVILFKDGNYLNNDLSNLEKISKSKQILDTFNKDN